MEVTMSQLVTEVEQLCQLRPSLDYYNTSSRHQLNSFELFFLVIGSLVVGVLLGVVGVACFKRQVMTIKIWIKMATMMKMMNMLVGMACSKRHMMMMMDMLVGWWRASSLR